jgi:hypothetical protein
MEVIFTGSSYRSGFPFISPLSTSGETSVISVILEEGFPFLSTFSYSELM